MEGVVFSGCWCLVVRRQVCVVGFVGGIDYFLILRNMGLGFKFISRNEQEQNLLFFKGDIFILLNYKEDEGWFFLVYYELFIYLVFLFLVFELVIQGYVGYIMKKLFYGKDRNFCYVSVRGQVRVMMGSYVESLQLLKVSWKEVYFGVKNKREVFRK